MQKIMKNDQKVTKRHFGGSPTVQKSADSRKTGKNRKKVNQKPIKKVTKKHQKGPKVCRKNAILGVKKAYLGVPKSIKKCHFRDTRRIKIVKNCQIPKTDSKKYSQKAHFKN